jgi:DNA polymerase-2
MKPNGTATKPVAGAEDHHECFYGVLGTSACRFFDPRLVIDHHARAMIMRQTKALIESQGYDVIYGDTDSTFVWLKKRIRDDARALAANWWPCERLVVAHLQKERLTSALELEFETHFQPFFDADHSRHDQGSKSATPG